MIMNRSVRARVLLRAAAMLVLAACSAPRVTAQPGAPIQSAVHKFTVNRVVDGLQFPWSIAFLPNGDMLVTEKPGRLRRVVNGQLQPEPISGTPTVWYRGQGGLLEVAPHPKFASNSLLYISYSKPSADGATATTALIRGKLQGNALVDVQELFVADAYTRAGQHFGAKIAFDSAGYVYMSVGDRGAPPSGNLEQHPAQNPANHQGTIIRLHDDGRVPANNPFVGQQGKRAEIWSYGHRNPQGLVVHPQTQQVWDVEHGPRGGDELNAVQPGRNYGWPVITYGINYSGTSITNERVRAGMEQPVRFWVPSIATSGLMVYTGEAFPQWKGSFFVGGLAGQQLARVMVDGAQFVSEETLLKDAVGRIRDVRQGPNGFIYLAIDKDGGEGSIVRLEPVK